MEKKKTIVLTMIGLATLMLLVIGSAFAYFSITNNSGGKTETNFTGETDQLEKYGTPTLTGESNLYLDLLVADMAQGKIGTSYWATDTKESRFEPERKDHIVSTAGISGSTTEEEAYLNCTSDLTITASVKKSGTEDQIEEDIITEGDGRVYLGYQSDKANNKASIDPNEIDLATIISETKNNKGYKTTVNYTIVGDSSVNITAAIELKNTKDDQTALAGKDIDINITNENLVCSVGEKREKVYAKLDNVANLDEDREYYYGTLYRSNQYIYKIVRASFVDYVPSEEELTSKPKYWDLSDTSKGTSQKSVIGWLEANEAEPNKYDLYIGSKGEIYTTDLSNGFRDMTNLKTITFDNLNTSEATNMSYLFGSYGHDMSIESLDLSNFDTSQVTDMSHMFGSNDYNTSIKEIKGLNHFNTEKVKNMANMFYGCNDLTTLDLSTFDTSKVTNMFRMFGNVSAELPFKEWQKFTTNNVENMSGMFSGYQGTTLDLSNFDTSQVTNMSSMFEYTNASITFPQRFGSAATYMSGMFSGYQGTTLDLSNFDTSKVENMSSMFNGVSAELPFKDWSKFTTSNVKNMGRMFESYQGTTLDLSTFDTSQVTDMSYMFQSCISLTNLDLSSFTFDKITTDGGYSAGNSGTFNYVPSECVVTIKSSQREIFEDKFPLGTGTFDRKFTPSYVD